MVTYHGRGFMAVTGRDAGAPPDDSPEWREVIMARLHTNETGTHHLVYIFPRDEAPEPKLDPNGNTTGNDQVTSVLNAQLATMFSEAGKAQYEQTVYLRHIVLPYNLISNDDEDVCFAAGSRIATISGERDVADLKTGDLVLTKDRGYQPIRWIGSTQVSVAAEITNAKRRPVRIAAGAFWASGPATDLVVSSQHRLLVKSEQFRDLAGDSEVLIAAKDLLDLPGITREAPVREVAYYHVLLDQHEVIFANGAAAESFYPGPTAQRMLSAEKRRQVRAAIPGLSEPDFAPAGARSFLKGRQARELVQAHAAVTAPLAPQG